MNKICPLMSRIVTSPESNKYGELSGSMHHNLRSIDCAKENCALWVIDKKDDLTFSYCGLLRRQ